MQRPNRKGEAETTNMSVAVSAAHRVSIARLFKKGREEVHNTWSKFNRGHTTDSCKYCHNRNTEAQHADAQA